jgi:hypothetical protein
MVPLAEGKTLASSACAWGERPVAVTAVDGVEALRGCRLQVQTERPSRISRKIKCVVQRVTLYCFYMVSRTDILVACRVDRLA